MINCYNCHRLHKNGGVYYCPFFDMHPCIRGEHYFNPKEVQSPKFREEALPVKETVKQPAPKPSTNINVNGLPFPISFYQGPIPKFIPTKLKNANSINYEPIHEKIFELLRCGLSIKKIAEEVGLKAATVRNYLYRYC